MGLGFFSLTNQIIPTMNSYNSATFSDWSVLSFNVRGINSAIKGNGTRCAIRDSRCDIVCLQETRRYFLTGPTLENYVPILWMRSLLFPRWEIQGASLLFGIALSWWAL
jgi:endonuclease/exonuclease/phosphatase family metal-dependent hydrolase